MSAGQRGNAPAQWITKDSAPEKDAEVGATPSADVTPSVDVTPSWEKLRWCPRGSAETSARLEIAIPFSVSIFYFVVLPHLRVQNFKSLLFCPQLPQSAMLALIRNPMSCNGYDFDVRKILQNPTVRGKEM